MLICFGSGGVTLYVIFLKKNHVLDNQWMIVKIPWILINAMIDNRKLYTQKTFILIITWVYMKPSHVLRKSCRDKLVHPITSILRRIPRSVLSSTTRSNHFPMSMAHLITFRWISLHLCHTCWSPTPPIRLWMMPTRFPHGGGLFHSPTKIINHDIYTIYKENNPFQLFWAGFSLLKNARNF